MAMVFGRRVDRQFLSSALGDMSQICGIRSFCFDDGPARGVRALEFYNGGGLRFLVLPDRGMDLFCAEYKGVPLNWLTGTGAVAPSYYSPQDWDWLRSFYGGLLMTCGLANVGEACRDRGAYLPEENFGAHGRIASTPASAVFYRGAWEGERYWLEAGGQMLEAAGQGEKLRLTRVVRTELGASSLQIEDSVQNESYYTLPHMFLYHINLGYPLLDQSSRLYARLRGVRGLDESSAANLATVGRMGPPDPSYGEFVFLLDQEEDGEGFCQVAFSNPALLGGAGLGLYLRYRKEQFPYLNLWKRLNCREYVVGFEPGNCAPQGRLRQRAQGDLRSLRPQDKADYRMEIGVLASNEEIRRFAQAHRLAAL
jgi:Domain of unknown function (DUF4432)